VQAQPVTGMCRYMLMKESFNTPGGPGGVAPAPKTHANDDFSKNAHQFRQILRFPSKLVGLTPSRLTVLAHLSDPSVNP